MGFESHPGRACLRVAFYGGWVDGPSGLELARVFFVDAVRPIVEDTVPGLRFSAARLGRGSEVLGYDDEMSRDHDWGPRLELFLDSGDLERHGAQIRDALALKLPATFAGFSTSFGVAPDGVGILVDAELGASVSHRVELHELSHWCSYMLGFDPRSGIGTFDWLGMSSHRLAEVTGGEVFHDGLGQLEPLRELLAYYPDPVWLYVLASQWSRIAEEEAFVGRCASVGDDLGSAVVAARLVRDLMRLCLMMERRYVPYSKWLGTAYQRLEIAELLTPHLVDTMRTLLAEERQHALTTAYEIVGEAHNQLGVTEPIDASARPFWKRGFPVILAGRFATALRRQLDDTELAGLPLVGTVDQWVDSTEVLGPAERARRAAGGLLQSPNEPD